MEKLYDNNSRFVSLKPTKETTEKYQIYYDTNLILGKLIHINKLFQINMNNPIKDVRASLQCLSIDNTFDVEIVKYDKIGPNIIAVVKFSNDLVQLCTKELDSYKDKSSAYYFDNNHYILFGPNEKLCASVPVGSILKYRIPNY